VSAKRVVRLVVGGGLVSWWMKSWIDGLCGAVGSMSCSGGSGKFFFGVAVKRILDV